MTAFGAIAWLSAALAALPLFMVGANLRRFARPSAMPPPATHVSILIPARDEAATIETALRGALACTGVEVEVLVLDDDSGDATAEIVASVAAVDSRVRLLRAPPLPNGWAGKQRACHLLSREARFEVLMFVDADVRLAPRAAACAAGFLLAGDAAVRADRIQGKGLGMVSGFPREIAVGLAERLVIPWIHILLLGYLPMDRMRRSSSPAYAAACGQWVVARRDAYLEIGGHAAAPMSRHDGTSLPRSFRTGGWRTDVFDGGELARCRMYDGAAAVWRGFGKSPGEGMATAAGLPAWTLLLGLGHLAPALLLAAGLWLGRADVANAAAVGVTANLALRLWLCARLGQPLLGALLHPIGAAWVLVNQWTSLLRQRLGRPSEWRGRRYGRPQNP